MYEFMRGTLKEKTPNRAILECAGIAYRLQIPLSTYTRLPAVESPILLYLSQVVREDAHTLYAFSLQEERDLFEILIQISGIGPKTAAGIIGHMEIGSFQRAIANADVRLLSKLPGIGKKTAERLVIEMRDRLKNRSDASSLAAPLHLPEDIAADAVSALVHLGYHAPDAQRAVQKARQSASEETDLGRLITASLRNL